MSRPPTRIIVCLFLRSNTPFNVGPEWSRYLHWALPRANQMSALLSEFPPTLLSDSVDVIRKAEPFWPTSSVLLKRPSGAPGNPSFPNSHPAACTLILSPFFFACDTLHLRDAVKRCIETERIVVSVRTPDPHPLHYAARRRITTDLGSAYTLRTLHSNQWRNHGLFFIYKGERFSFRRQNYPTAHEACGAFLAAPPGLGRSVMQHVIKGDFVPVPLQEPACLDVSDPRQHLLYQHHMDLARRKSGASRASTPIDGEDLPVACLA